MAPFTIFVTSTRQPGTYNTPAVEIPVGRMFDMHLSGLDIVNEPIDTIIEWRIELSYDGGETWELMTGSQIVGRGGIPLPKDYKICVEITGLTGYLARGTITTNKRLFFGLQGDIRL